MKFIVKCSKGKRGVLYNRSVASPPPPPPPPHTHTHTFWDFSILQHHHNSPPSIIILTVFCVGTSKAPPVLNLSYSTGRRYLCSLIYILCTYAYNTFRLVLYCSLDPAPRAIFCIQHSHPCYNYYIQYFLLYNNYQDGKYKFKPTSQLIYVGS